MNKISNEDLVFLFQAAVSLKKLHEQENGLEMHRRYAEQKLNEYRKEILKRMENKNNE